MIRFVWLSLFILFLGYTILVYMQGKDEGRLHDELALKGIDVWQSKNCQSCHQVYGLGGYMGPDLTNVYSTKGREYIKGIIQYGTGRMPDYHLTDGETEQLISYLKWVDESGRTEVKASSVHWTGTYILNE
jgi:nitric oxide reductase subunit C